MEFNNWCLCETINPLYIADVMKSMNYCISGFHPLKCESIDKSDLQFSAQYCPKSNTFATRTEAVLYKLRDYKYETKFEANENGRYNTFYICKEGDCNKEFSRTNNLLDHIRMHFGIKPFICQFCNKGFTQKSNMK